MNLYLDDDSAKTSLAGLLKRVGHQVVVPADAGLSSASDPRHFMHAVQQSLVLLTKNHDDFEDLHFLGAGHRWQTSRRFDRSLR